MREWVAEDGVTYTVSDRGEALITKGLGEVWPSVTAAEDIIRYFGQVKSERELTPEETDRNVAAYALCNMNRATKFLGRRDHHEMVDHIDELHGVLITNPCGCVLRQIHNHYHAMDGVKDIKTYPHTSHKACDKHAHLMQDMKAHHEAVFRDNQPSNDA